MPTPLWKATIHNGLLKIEKDFDYRQFLKTLEGDVMLTVKRPQKHRSNRENNYYWGVVIDLLSNELGYTADEMHGVLKFHFLRGKGDSTAELSTVDFENYLSQIRTWASSELHVYIPEPGEVEPN